MCSSHLVVQTHTYTHTHTEGGKPGRIHTQGGGGGGGGKAVNKCTRTEVCTFYVHVCLHRVHACVLVVVIW